MDEHIKNILNIVKQNIQNNKYKKLSKEESDIVRNAYMSGFNFLPIGNMSFYNKARTLIAIGYNRIVSGDYGVYMEFSSEQIQTRHIVNKWAGEPKRPVKYIWMQTCDCLKTKVYLQKGHVSYADYKPGMYYVDPAELYVDDLKLYNRVI